ncbi:MAG: sigma-54-dependent transcriptional regulator [Vicinamibacterales bacterium]
MTRAAAASAAVPRRPGPRPRLDATPRPAMSWRPAATFHGLIGRTPAMQQLFAAMARFAPFGRTTLVTGEIGTGKTAVARTLYRLGPRRGGAFVTVSCADRHRDGGGPDWATAANEAHDATLFFTDVADLPGADQLRLIRLLTADDERPTGAAGVHVIAATACDLRDAMAVGRFRSDLYYQLGVFTLHLPPLRQRLADLPDFTRIFLREIAGRLGLGPRAATAAAIRRLQGHDWPGNLRELRNVLERAAVLSDGELVGEGAVSAALVDGAPRREPAVGPAPAPARLDDAQRAHVRAVLHGVGGNKTRAAASLGISRRALYRLLDRLGA